jgi:hypothetical protein
MLFYLGRLQDKNFYSGMESIRAGGAVFPSQYYGAL